MFITTAGGGAIAATLLGGILGGSAGGSAQGGTQTQNRDPWAAAQPWMKQNLQDGQNLQTYYQQNPFNAQQKNAFSNLSQGTNYMNELTPSLLAQFSQPQGFDRSNPQARPQAFNFNTPNLGFGNIRQQSAPMQNQMPTYTPPPPPPQQPPQQQPAWFSGDMGAFSF